MQKTTPSPYTLRQARPDDAERIAHHRACMFEDMGLTTGEETKTLFETSVPWLRNLLLTEGYVGWLAFDGSRL